MCPVPLVACRAPERALLFYPCFVRGLASNPNRDAGFGGYPCFENARGGGVMRTARALERHLEEDIVARHGVTSLARPPSPPDAPSTPLTPGRSGRGRGRSGHSCVRFSESFGRLQISVDTFQIGRLWAKGHGFRRTSQICHHVSISKRRDRGARLAGRHRQSVRPRRATHPSHEFA
jgi:hypothetical protein